MSYGQRPWLARYADDQPADAAPDYPTMLAAWQAAATRSPDAVAIRYFDYACTVSKLDEMADAFAVALSERGVRKGDRVGLYLQNVPQFVIALLGSWKIGAVAVSINPMNKERELTELLTDSGAVALVCLESLYDIARAVLPKTSVRLTITTSELEYQTRNDERIFAGVSRVRQQGTEDMATLIEAHRRDRPAPVELEASDIAVLTYTSGTTGPPKGAMNTHGNMVFNAQTYRDWLKLDERDAIFGVAPLFHITGLVGHVAVALLIPCPLIIACRFEPNVVLEAVREHRATFTIGSITVFIALLNTPGAEREHLASLTKVYSGGAPIPPSTVEQFIDKFGHYIHCAYGLTETNSPAHMVPLNTRAPVDPATGAMSIGVPVYSTVVRIVDDAGAELPPGEIGELVVSGPVVVPGYWNKPEETAKALPGGALHTGDVGYMDADGWFYLVDRKKDQINAAGYKVWPREVEDVLYEHPAVREVAVVGVPDEYRGETVKAFVSLKPGTAAESAELIAFAKERLAAYKYPRSVELLAELPKTVTGKILRRELR
ncbi:long-chain acyl-CoA synthetase [Tamaricihabitans halophyticus]|uniref:Long-chain acyl-CoA synthetase n=1 Tax=Tamaricihabitans halophyticus TaxID=1262583 RepID=A0A4R2R2I0_9PSEU|nr:AMP-binding protein [Tamaricihabitans halophyticus]TCP56950.1 long-chain acyl-CoA synthetase [Tamaricihabitans halophyticus]